MSLERTQPPLRFEKPSLLITGLLEINPSPLRSPLDDNEWLRKFPNNKSSQHAKPIGHEIGVSPGEGALMAVRHLGQLAELGVVQPTKSYYFYEDRLYTVAEHVWGINLSHMLSRQRASRFAERREQFHAYVNWVQAEQETGVLWDVIDPRQQRVGWTQSDEAYQIKRTYLVDTDPLLMRANRAGLRTMRQNIDKLYATDL